MSIDLCTEIKSPLKVSKFLYYMNYVAKEITGLECVPKISISIYENGLHKDISEEYIGGVSEIYNIEMEGFKEKVTLAFSNFSGQDFGYYKFSTILVSADLHSPVAAIDYFLAACAIAAIALIDKSTVEDSLLFWTDFGVQSAEEFIERVRYNGVCDNIEEIIKKIYSMRHNDNLYN